MIVRTCLKPEGNFGDSAINSYLVEKITGKKPQLMSISTRMQGVNYLVSGSVLASANIGSVVWGAGFLSKHDKLSSKPLITHAVRGKLSREMLLEQGVTCPEVYGDPALLLPRFYQPRVIKDRKVGIVPHYGDINCIRDEWKNIQYRIIDICAGVERVIDSICASDLILSSSLHGLIVADAYGIPSFWVKLSDNVKGEGFKFADYYSVRHKVDLAKLWEACPFK